MDAKDWIHDDEANQMREVLRQRTRYASWILIIGAAIALFYMMSTHGAPLFQQVTLRAAELIVLGYGVAITIGVYRRKLLLAGALHDQETKLEEEAEQAAAQFEALLGGEGKR